MKRSLFLLLLVGLALLLVGCGQWVPPGFVGIKVNQLGSQRGVQSETLGVGRHYIGAYAKMYLYPTFIQQYPFTKTIHEGAPVDESFTFQTKEGILVTQDIAFQGAADPALVTTLFQTYRVDMNEIIHTYVHQSLRNLFIKYSSGLGVDDLYGDGKNVMLANVFRDLKAEYASQGLIVDSITYLSPPRFPDVINNAIEAKQKAQQDAFAAQNKVQQAHFEAQQAIETARGVAEANRITSMSITDELIRWKAVTVWDGHLPQVTSGGTPFVNLK